MTTEARLEQLHRLPAESVHRLRGEFALLAGLQDAQAAQQWSAWWYWRAATELAARLGLPASAGPEPRQPGLETLSPGELSVLSGWFSELAAHCELHGLAEWCRTLVAALHAHLAARTAEDHPEVYEAARAEAQFQVIAAEENRRARAGKPPPDLRGLPTWVEISGPPGTET